MKITYYNLFDEFDFREEAETEDNKKKSDEMRLKLAIEKSKEETAKVKTIFI